MQNDTTELTHSRTTESNRKSSSPTKPKTKKATTPFLLIAPALILVIVFAAFPLIRSAWFAFNDISPFTGDTSFTGLENFSTMFASPDFGATMGRTAVWVFGTVSLQFAGGLCLALILNNRFPLRGIYRGLVMVPWATPSVLVALMWKWILDPNFGIINTTLLSAGIINKPIEFLSSSNTALTTIIMVDVWQGIPLFAVMILAALQAVPGELKEAARIDGCSKVGVFKYVVWPVILPTILITFLLRLIWTANYVDLLFILTGGGPGNSTTTLALQSYLTTYRSTDFGQGAAFAVLQAIILTIFLVLYMRLTNKKEEK